MKFTCTKENLLRGLQLVGGVATKPSNLPILSHVLIKAQDSGVSMISTNLEIAVTAAVRAKVDKSGAFTVPAKTIVDFVSLLGEELVTVELDGQEVHICGEKSKTKIKGIPAEEYPVIPEVEQQHLYSISVDHFRDALARVVFAAAKNDIRPELSGVYFGFFTNGHAGLTTAATDSYRLAESKISVDQGADEVTCIVPARTVYEFVRLLSTSKEEQEKLVRVLVSDSQIALRYDSLEVTSRLVDGQYPDYTQIIPAKFQTTLVAPIDLMQTMIKAASLFTTTGVNAVSFHLDAEEKTLKISSISTQTGEHESVLDSIEVIGETNNILLNHRYVLDGLQHMVSGEVELKMNSPEAPCVFKQKESDDYLYIVMPIRQ